MRTRILLTILFSLLLVVAAHAEDVAEKPNPLNPEDVELVRLYHHKPMYILLGKPETKIQFSFKARVLKNGDLYFGYSQLMMWEFFHTSRPFRDINYNPELFYRWIADFGTVDFGIFEHESNGKDGLDSRSWDRHYVQITHDFELGGSRVLESAFKIWVARGFDDTNRDILWYRGLYEFNLTVENLFGPTFGLSELSLRFYPGGKTHVNPIDGGRELTLRMRHRGSYEFLNYVVQLFEGHAESLLNYKQHVLGARAGINF